jgi:plasmid stabilization system protein ParE
MANGYNVLWTDHALEELAATIHYLEINFPDDVPRRLSIEIEKIVKLIAVNPLLFAESMSHKGIRKAVVLKYNSMYYRVDITKNQIIILSFFSNRQSSDKIEI